MDLDEKQFVSGRNLNGSRAGQEGYNGSGLLSSYRKQQAFQNTQNALPAQARHPLDVPEENTEAQNGRQRDQHSLLTQTLLRVKGLSGKIRVVGGVQPLPPAPYMERATTPAQARRYTRNWKLSRAVRVSMLMKQRRIRWQRAHPGRQIASALLLFLCVALLLSTVSTTVYGYTYYESQLPRLHELAHQAISQTTRIYDRNLTLLFDAYDHNLGRRSPILYDNVPEVMRDAIIAAEDHTFWTNSGLDSHGIVRAALSFLYAGSVQGGGSTIAQQVMKNLTGNTEVSLARKLPEAALAVGLTQWYPKTKILEMYLNVAPFGPQDLGVEAATQEYFGLRPQCNQSFQCVPAIAQLDYDAVSRQHTPLLALARATLLAGMPQNPVGYYPAGGAVQRAHALARQKDVLQQMIALHISVEGKVLTPKMAQDAEALTAQMSFTPYSQSKRAPHFVDWIINQVETALGNGDPNRGVVAFLNGGFNIRTTVDVQLEEYTERAVKRHLTQPEAQMFLNDSGPLDKLHNVHDAAVVVLNAHTGEILAMDGSADYFSTDSRVGGAYNAAASGDGRQPGSTFKPFVYATAFEMGWYPSMILPDYKTYFPNGAQAGTPMQELYAPPDYGTEEDYHHNYPDSTIRQSIAESLNVPAVKAMEYAGSANVLTTVKRMGLTNMQNTGVAWALGSNSATVLQMTGAYQVFANGGMRIPPQGVLDIWDNYGNSLYHYDLLHIHSERVFSSQISYLMNSILMDEPSRYNEFLNDHVLSFTDRDPSCSVVRECSSQVAAKTGTTDNFVDNWTIGYTPNVVVGVWAGNGDGTPMKDIVGITGAAPIWHSVISTVDGHCPADDLLACPDLNTMALGLRQDSVFPKPESGLERVCTSPVDGLATLSPANSKYCDYTIAGQQPQQIGSDSIYSSSLLTPVAPVNQAQKEGLQQQHQKSDGTKATPVPQDKGKKSVK